MSTQSSTGGGISFAGLLTIVFITLKLLHVINWSWIWVLAPLWIGFAIFMFLSMIFLLLYLLFGREERKIKKTTRYKTF